jgi:hypothetical protein
MESERVDAVSVDIDLQAAPEGSSVCCAVISPYHCPFHSGERVTYQSRVESIHE